MRGALGWVIAASVGAGVALSCTSSVYNCSQDEDCVTASGQLGRCEDNGYCSFSTEDCESGRRYSQYAGDGLASECVPPGVASGESGESGDPSSSPESDGSSDGSAATTSVVDSSTGAPGACPDGELDPGEDCDDGNMVDGDGCNNDCVVSGSLLMEVTYNSPANEDDKGYALAIDPAGRIAISGHSADGVENALEQLYEPDFTREFSVTVSGGSGGRGDGVDFTPDGDLVFCGNVLDDAGASIAWLQRRDSLGGEVWTHLPVAATGAYDRIFDVAIDAQGDIFVVGRVRDMGTGLWLGRFDETAAPVWAFSDDITPIGYGSIYALELDGDDGFLVASSKRDAPSPDASIAQYDRDGMELWRAVVDGEEMGADVAEGLAVGPDGTVGVAGWFTVDASFSGWMGLFTIGSDTPSWQYLEAGSGAASDEGKDVEFLPDGGFVLVGWLNEASDDFWVQRFDPAGQRLWNHLDDHEGLRDRAFQVELAPDGTLVVVGYVTTADQGADLVLRRYAP